MITHYHINTTHMNGTPPYPSKEAVYIYRTGCAKELKSTNSDDYKLVQGEARVDEIDCRPCAVWAKYYFSQNENINGNYIFKSAPKEAPHE